MRMRPVSAVFRAIQVASLLACLMVGSLAIAQTARPRMGVASMDAAGTLTVTYDETSPGFAPWPLVIGQDDPNEHRRAAYDSYVQMAGGLQPGESKPLYPFDALVEMNADRSLSVIVPGPEPVNPPIREQVAVGSSRYNQILELVGGLAPGQTKGVHWP